jgi:hypothetical protein
MSNNKIFLNILIYILYFPSQIFYVNIFTNDLNHVEAAKALWY